MIVYPDELPHLWLTMAGRMLGQGGYALFGWCSLAVPVSLAVIAVFRGRRAYDRSPPWFYGAAHVQYLVFILTNVVDSVRGFFGMTPGAPDIEGLLYLIGMIVIGFSWETIILLACVIAVFSRTRKRPTLRLLPVLCFAVLAADIAALYGYIPIIITMRWAERFIE